MELGEVSCFNGLEGSPLLGLTEANREESVVCTSVDGGVSVYDVSTRQSVLSWIVTPPESITVPVSYIPTANLYTAVKNKDEFIYWDPSVQFASDFKVLKLSRPVHSLLTTPSSHVIIAVYDDTSLEILNYSNNEYETVSQLRKRKKAKSGQFIISHTVALDSDIFRYIMVVYKTKKVGGDYHASLYSLLVENLALVEVDTIVINAKDHHGVLKSIVPSSTSLYFTWSEGCVQKIDSSQLIFRLEFDFQPLSMLGCPTGLTCFDDKFIVTLHNQNRIDVFDMKYHTHQSSLMLTEPVVSLSQCYHGYLFLFSSYGELIGCSVSAVSKSPPSLANALGKGLVTTPTPIKLSIADGIKSLQSVSKKIESFLSLEASDSERLKTCRSLLKKISSPSSSHAIFPIVLQLTQFLLGSKQVDSDASDSTPSQWHRPELLILIRSGAYPISMSGPLYIKALQQSDWALLAESLEYIKCIPEDIIVQIIDAIIQLPDGYSVTLEGDQPLTLCKDQLLWKTLSLPRNDAQILRPLTEMSQSSVISLLDHLSQYINTCYITTATNDQWSQFEDAIDWIGLVLDSHFSRLILIPSVQARVQELRKCVSEHMKVMSNLSILASIGKMSSKPTIHSNWLYKVDKIDLDCF